MGQDAKAKLAIERALEMDPSFSVAKCTSVPLAPYKDPADVAHLRENLLKAGLPE